MRGSKRYNDVGGHSPPGDELENTRDHERIWFEMRRHRSCCCDENNPGFSYCFPDAADYETLVCNEDYFVAWQLIDYWPGFKGVNAPPSYTGLELKGGCGTALNTGWNLNGGSEYKLNGSWRNGPIFGLRSTVNGEANFFGTGITHNWQMNSILNTAHSWEVFMKPSQTDIDLSGFLAGYSGSYSFGLGLDNYYTLLGPGGKIGVYSPGVNGGDVVWSATGVITADEWHYIVFVRSEDNGGYFSMFVNGVRVLYIAAPLTLSPGPSSEFVIKFGAYSWASDFSRYWGTMPVTHIRKRARIMKGALVEQTDGGFIEDPGDVIITLPPDAITADNVPAGYVMLSTGETGYWESPEASVFELEARKGQPDGYASLGPDGFVPTDELGTGTADANSFLRGDLTWDVGRVVPPSTGEDEMLQSAPDASDEYLAAALTTVDGYWTLDEAATPWANEIVGGASFTALGSPVVVSADPAFGTEKHVQFAGGTDGLTTPDFYAPADFNDLGMAGWFYIDALPASAAMLFRVGSLADYVGIRLRTDGKITHYNSDTATETLLSGALTLGRWYHIALYHRPSGVGPTCALAIDGVVVGSGAVGGFGSHGSKVIVAGDGFEGKAAHVGVWHQPPGIAALAALYQYRRWTWGVFPLSGGIEASENGVDATAAARARINFIEGANVALTVADDAGNNEIDVTIAATAPAGSGIEVDKNDADVTAAPRGRLNFVEGTGIALTVADDAVNDEVDITIAATGGGGGVEVDLNDADVTAAARGRLNFIEGAGIDLTIADDAANGEVDITIAATGGGGGGGHPLERYEARSTNTVLGTADDGKTIDVTAAITQTFSAAATLGAGWSVTLRNATSDGTVVVTLDPNGAETIDSLGTVKMYAGETRKIICDGTGFHSHLIQGGFAKFTANGTFVVPHGVTKVIVRAVGGGGGGASGRGGGDYRVGGSGGGGGAGIEKTLSAAGVGGAGASVAVTVGAGGAGAASPGAANGTPGGDGGNTTFGAFVVAGGGGGGRGGDNSGVMSGGGGGGEGEQGQAGVDSGSTRGGAASAAAIAGVGTAGGGSFANTSTGAAYPAQAGGGGGGAAQYNGAISGGTSLSGGGGGGAGGGVNNASAPASGTAGGGGGATGTYVATPATGGGGANTGANGSNGADGTYPFCGAGGAGGGANGNGNGGAGGAGGTPGGGGGGGGGATGNGGAGGAGGRGECLVWYS